MFYAIHWDKLSNELVLVWVNCHQEHKHDGDGGFIYKCLIIYNFVFGAMLELFV